MGIVFANQRMAPVDHILEFKENLRVLFIAILFIVLTARLSLQDLAQLSWGTPVFIAAIILVARPLGVLASTVGSDLDWRSRAFLMCMAPRGIVAAAVASIFGIELARLGLDEGSSLTAVTFLTIAATVTVYGVTARPIAHRLGVAVANPQGLLIVGAHPFARAIGAAVKAAGIRVLLVDTNRENVTAARMAGLPVVLGSIVGERGFESLNLGGLGRLLAMTPNDEVNVLASQRFMRLFGRESVFQLAPKRDQAGRAQIDRQLQGRWLFRDTAAYKDLNERMQKNAVIKATKLSADFGFDAFLAHHGPSALVLFRLDPKGRLMVQAAEATSKPSPGETVFALVDRPTAGDP
jgi:NhaP-type Na+/H+ or K+/H+ antiporter